MHRLLIFSGDNSRGYFKLIKSQPFPARLVHEIAGVMDPAVFPEVTDKPLDLQLPVVSGRYFRSYYRAFIVQRLQDRIDR